MSKIYTSADQLIGKTPLLELTHLEQSLGLEAIVKDLVKNNILNGVRGKGGGYRLCRPPEQINVGEILCCMEGGLAPVACLEDGAAPCARASECRTLEFWRGLDDVIRRYTHSYTVADLMWQGQGGNDYII